MKQKKKHFVELETYIFGSSREIVVETDHTIAEIKASWDLREKLINEALIAESMPQDSKITEWWN